MKSIRLAGRGLRWSDACHRTESGVAVCPTVADCCRGIEGLKNTRGLQMQPDYAADPEARSVYRTVAVF